MPRRNKRDKRRRDWLGDGAGKPAGKKRPRGWHRGAAQDALYEKAIEQLEPRERAA